MKKLFVAAFACAMACGVFGNYIQAWRGLPAGYAQVEYIESTGSQYIDTDIVPGTSTAVDFTFNLVAYESGKAFFGQKWSNNYYLFNEQSDKFYFHGGGDLKNDLAGDYGKVIVGNDYRCQIEPTESNSGTLTLTWGGVTRSCTVTLSAGSGKMRIFGSTDSGHFSKIKVYGMKIWQGGELVADLVPAIDGEGKGGLYNLIGEANNWLANGGTDAFKVGAAVPDPNPDGFTPMLTATGARRIYRSGACEIYEWTKLGEGNGFTVPEGGITTDILLVGGGGAGGMTRGGGGGGGGVVLANGQELAAGAYTVTVGAGGIPQYTTAAYKNSDNNGSTYSNGKTPDTATGGSSSVIGGSTELVALGGGGGGNFNYNNNDQANTAGLAGGSGGGAGGHNEKAVAGGAGTEGQGSAGANNATPSSGGGGGGGAGGVGGLPSTTKAGDGGPGREIDITGEPICYGGGGGGGAYSVAAGAGGVGGGGDGNYDKHGPLLAQNGIDGLGGGGGGGGAKSNNGWYGVGGVGGSGTVVLRVLLKGMVGLLAEVDNSKARELGVTATVNASDDQPTDTFDVYAAIGADSDSLGEFVKIAEGAALNANVSKVFGGLDAATSYCVALKAKNRNTGKWSDVWTRTVTTSAVVYPFEAVGPSIVKTETGYEVSLLVASVQDDAENVTATLNGEAKSVTGAGAYAWQVPASGGGCSATVTLACTVLGYDFSRDFSASVSGDVVIVPVADPSEHASSATALKLHVGDGILLPPLTGSATYTILNHSFLAQEGDVITAIKPGIVGIECRSADGATVTTVAVIVLPEKIGEGNIYIWNEKGSGGESWCSAKSWFNVDGTAATDFPKNVDDIAIIPHYDVSTKWLKLNQNISLGGLYAGRFNSVNADSYVHINRSAAPTPTLTFQRSDGEPVIIQICGNAVGYEKRYLLYFADSNDKVNFYYASDTIVDGGWDGINSQFAGGRPSYAANCTNTVPAGVTLTWRNMDNRGGDRATTFTPPLLVGGGMVWNRSAARIWYKDRDYSGFTGTFRDSSYGSEGSWLSQPTRLATGTISNTAVEVYGFVGNSGGSPSVDITKAAGVLGTGGDHPSVAPAKHSESWFPKRGLTLVNGSYQCNQIESSGWGSGLAELKQTDNVTIGQGFSAVIPQGDLRNTSSGHPLNWFETADLTHLDKGTLRFDDLDAKNQNNPSTPAHSVSILHGYAKYAVGGGTDDPKTGPSYPIVPWLVGQSKKSNDSINFVCVDENERVCGVSFNNTGVEPKTVTDPNQNVYAWSKSLALNESKTFNSLMLCSNGNSTKMGADKTLTLTSGGLILYYGGSKHSSIGTQTGGADNGALILGDETHPGYVFACSTSATSPCGIWAPTTAKGGLVFGYTGYALLAGDQTGVDDELVVNAGTLDLGSQDKTVACTLDVPVRILANATVKMNNAEISNSAIYFDDIAGYSGKVQLNADTTCKKLYVRDTPEESEWTSLPRGTYGATGSGAANIDDAHFSGSGVLTVRKDDITRGLKLILR